MSPRNVTAPGFNGLGFEVYRALRDETPNLVISPVSIALALAATWAGARAETADELARALGLTGTRDEILDGCSALVASLVGGGAVDLAIANRLFCAAKGALVPDFVGTCERTFRAGCEALDFASDPERARDRVNGFVAKATHGRIRELLPPGSIDAATPLVLANAIYLGAKWAEPFEKTATRPGPFHGRGGTTSVSKMCGKKSLGSVWFGPSLRALDVPYAGGRFGMLLLVPEDGAGFEELERGLSHERIADVVANLSPAEVQLDLPRVDVSAAPSLSLVPPLERAGVHLAFDPARADLGGIVAPARPEDRLHVAKAFHGASIRIDEAGTEAAAATAMVFAPFGAPPNFEAPPVFDVDRPFLYAVREYETGAVLFVGRVVDPTSAR